jgi:hypothetical protein
MLALFRRIVLLYSRLVLGETQVDMNASHPRSVRMSAPSGVLGFLFRPHASHPDKDSPTNLRAVAAEDITLLLSKMIRAYYGFRYHRTRRTIFMVGTGSPVSPINFCLSAQGFGTTDPTILPPSTV